MSVAQQRGAVGGVAGGEAKVSCSPTRYAHVATVGHQQLHLIVILIVIVLIVVLVIVALWQQPVVMCLYSPIPHPHPSPLLFLSAVLGEAGTLARYRQRRRQGINTFMVCNRLA